MKTGNLFCFRLTAVSLLLFIATDIAFSQRRRPANQRQRAAQTLYFKVGDSQNLELMSAALSGGAKMNLGRNATRVSVVAMETIRGKDMCRPDESGIKDFTLWTLSARKGSRLVVNQADKKASVLVVGEMTRWKPANSYCRDRKVDAKQTGNGSFYIGYPTAFHPSPETFYAVAGRVASTESFAKEEACNNLKRYLPLYYRLLRTTTRGAVEPGGSLFLNVSANNPFGPWQGYAPVAPSGLYAESLRVVNPGMSHSLELAQQFADMLNPDQALHHLETQYQNYPTPSAETLHLALVSAAQADYSLNTGTSPADAYLPLVTQFMHGLNITDDGHAIIEGATKVIRNLRQHPFRAINADYLAKLMNDACKDRNNEGQDHHAYLRGPEVNAALVGISSAPNVPMAFATSSVGLENVPAQYREMIRRQSAQVRDRTGMDAQAASLTGQAGSRVVFAQGVPRLTVHYKVEIFGESADLKRDLQRGAELILNPPALPDR